MTDTNTPATVMRRAAELMRTGAKGYPQRISNARATVIGQTYTSPTYPPAGAEFIASMHPGVALPFAALLEAVANLADLTHDYDTGNGTVTTTPTAIEVAAYGAALAYLGEPTS